MRSVIVVPFVQFKKREKKNHGGVLLLVKLQALNKVTLLHGWLHKWYQIAQSVSLVFVQKECFGDFEIWKLLLARTKFHLHSASGSSAIHLPLQKEMKEKLHKGLCIYL